MPRQKPVQKEREPKQPRVREPREPRVREERRPRPEHSGDSKEWTLVGDRGKPRQSKPRTHVTSKKGATVITIESK